MLNSTVTHEMMTPLNCVTTFSERLVNHLPDPRHRGYAKLIYRTSKLLKSYIRDLLDRNLIEKGQLVPNLQKCNMQELITEIDELMRYQA